MQPRIALILAGCGISGGRRFMRIAAVVGLIVVAGALSGCAGSAGHSVEFVASNSDSVLLDFNARSPGELSYANETAAQQCQIFARPVAVLESLNVRREGTIRATYLCKGPTRTASVSNETRLRQ
jgi:hypothetical protein